MFLFPGCINFKIKRYEIASTKILSVKLNGYRLFLWNLQMSEQKINLVAVRNTHYIRTQLEEKCIRRFIVSDIFYQIFIFHQMIALQKALHLKSTFGLKIFKFLYFNLPLFFSLSAIALEVVRRSILNFMTSSTT